MFDLPKYGDGICLARLAELLDVLGIDRARLQRNSVVVTGSNGKGSTAAMCAAIGRAYGLRTGLFTSPHLLRFNERIRIDDAEIGDDDFARCKQRVEAAIAAISQQRGEQFGAFEALFALACLHFQESGCEFIVFEAGIGGRYDPVRLVGARKTCVTSVDYEHVELLGNTLELIVSDKSDACASGGTIIYGENCRGLRRHLLEYNRHRGDHVAVRPRRDRHRRRAVVPVGTASSITGSAITIIAASRRACSARFSSTTPRSRPRCSCSGCKARQPRKAPERIEAAVRAGLRETNGRAVSKSSRRIRSP